MIDPYIQRVDEDDWDSNRDEKWENEKDELHMDRGEWEYWQNVEDYGLTDEDMDSGDE